MPKLLKKLLTKIDKKSSESQSRYYKTLLPLVPSNIKSFSYLLPVLD